MAKEDMNNMFDKEYPDSARMGTVYAGPETFNKVVLPPTPVMEMVYAGPDMMANGIGLHNGFTIPGIGMANSATAGSTENNANSKTCPACSAIIRAEARFCTECGAQLVQMED